MENINYKTYHITNLNWIGDTKNKYLINATENLKEQKKDNAIANICFLQDSFRSERVVWTLFKRIGFNSEMDYGYAASSHEAAKIIMNKLALQAKPNHQFDVY